MSMCLHLDPIQSCNCEAKKGSPAYCPTAWQDQAAFAVAVMSPQLIYLIIIFICCSSHYLKQQCFLMSEFVTIILCNLGRVTIILRALNLFLCMHVQ